MKPLVSIVLEAYNDEFNALAPPADTLDALGRQDFPLDRAELVLLCSERQIEAWRALSSGWTSFQSVRLLSAPAGKSHYWQLKNAGARAADGEFIAFVDSDVVPGPHWLSSIVDSLAGGADVAIGPSLFRTESLRHDSARMLAAALPSWGFILARTSTPGEPHAASLAAHNVGMRRSLALAHPFVEGERSFSSSLLFFELARSGVSFAYQTGQHVAHGMNLRWWITRKHFRTGWETYAARNADSDWPRVEMLTRVPFIEPVILRMGLVVRDATHWFRFRRVAGVSLARAVALFPLVTLSSFAARTAEMAGMYAYLIAPDATRHQARF